MVVIVGPYISRKKKDPTKALSTPKRKTQKKRTNYVKFENNKEKTTTKNQKDTAQ